jgi:hypothetical protein
MRPKGALSPRSADARPSRAREARDRGEPRPDERARKLHALRGEWNRAEKQDDGRAVFRGQRLAAERATTFAVRHRVLRPLSRPLRCRGFDPGNAVSIAVFDLLRGSPHALHGDATAAEFAAARYVRGMFAGWRSRLPGGVHVRSSAPPIARRRSQVCTRRRGSPGVYTLAPAFMPAGLVC